MALADWDRVTGGCNGLPLCSFESYAGQNWGVPVLHSALSSPLSGVGQGAYLRKLGLSDFDSRSVSATVLASIGAGVAGGAYVGPDETRAQEGRAWMRNNGYSFFSSVTSAVAIGGRWQQALSGDGFDNWSARGYFASFGTTAPDGSPSGGVLRARLLASSGGIGTNPIYKYVEASADPATGLVWAANKWYRFRWRLVPYGLAQDDMQMHRLVDGGDENNEADWLLCCSLSVSAALDAGVYTPPGAGTRYGFAACLVNNGGVNNANLQAYIDLVEFREAAV